MHNIHLRNIMKFRHPNCTSLNNHLCTFLAYHLQPGRIKEFLLVENLIIRRQRLDGLANLLVTHDMKVINENFYDLIAEEKLPGENDPYEIDWIKYDSLAPIEEARQ